MKLFKKATAVVLSIAMLFSTTVVYASPTGVGNYTMEVSDTTSVSIGDEITVTLSNNAMTVESTAVLVNFDNTTLKCTDISGTLYAEYPEYIGIYTVASPPLSATVTYFSSVSTVDGANSMGYVSFGIIGTETAYDSNDGFVVITFEAIAEGDSSIQLEEESAGDYGYKTSSGTYLDLVEFAITDSNASTTTSYAVKFYNEDGSAVLGTDTVDENDYASYSGDDPTKDESETHTYEFAGWATSTNADAEDVVDLTTTAITAATDFYAVFTATPKTYTVTFLNADETTTFATVSANVGDAITVPTDTPDKASTASEKYTFMHWSTTSGGDEVSSWILNDGDTLYPCYTTNTIEYTVIFMNEDGTTQLGTFTQVVGVAATAPTAPEKEADTSYTYEFAGWSTVKGSTSDIVTSYSFTTDTTLYAVYTATAAFSAEGYSLQVVIADGNYNVGDTITATIVATAENKEKATEVFGSFQFTLVYDSVDLTLENFSSEEYEEAIFYNGKAVYAAEGPGFSASTTGTTLATAKFTVNNTISTGEETISLTKAYISVQSDADGNNGSEGEAWSVTSGTADVYNLTVTFNGGDHTENATGTTYVKYGEATLYTSNAYTTSVTPSVTASTGYRLAGDVWLNNNDDTNYYASTDTFTADASYTAQTVEQYTITVGKVTNGDWQDSETQTITIDANDTLQDVLDDGYLAVKPDNNYTLGSYYNGTTALSTTDALTNGMTIDATCVANSFAFTPPTDTNATIAVTDGLTEGKTTYGDDLVIEVEPAGGYVVTSVSYTVGEDEASYNATTDSAGTTKTYTIDGDAITGEITVTVTVQKYHTITFEDVDGAKLDGEDENVVLYALNNTSTLYASAENIGTETTASIPTVTADDTYRIGGTSDTYQWVGVDETTLTTKVFTEKTTYTAAVTKQYTVTFNNTDGFGSITGTNTVTVDTGTDLTSITFPTYSASTGYQFNSWSQTSGTITSNTTITASFKLGTYTITDNTGDVATYVGATTAIYNTNFAFTVTAVSGNQLNSVTATIAGVDDPIVFDVNTTDNTYTIEGSKIVGNITITVDTDSTSQLTFKLATDSSSMATGDAVVLTVLTENTADDIDGKLSTEQIASIEVIEATANAGYKFVGWYDAATGGTEVTLDDIVATADATYYAVFEDASYAVTATDINGVDSEATHGTAFTFTPSITGSYIYGVTAKIGENEITVTLDETDGSYTIGGDDITGDITITVDSFEGNISYIADDEYMALANDTTIVVLETTQLEGFQYTLDNKAFYWSSAYNAYVQIVEESTSFDMMDTAVLATMFAKTSGDATSISYTGNLDNSGTGVMAYDASIVNDLLYGYGTYEDKDRFAADVTGDKLVSTADMKWILNTAVGISNDTSTND